MAFSQTQLQALENALAMGVLEVEYDGQKVKYQSVAALKSAISYVKSQMNQAAGTPSHMATYAEFTRD